MGQADRPFETVDLTQPGAEDAALNTLSGRFLILTTVFVMVAEVLIFVPSVARFREDYLLSKLEKAQIASLALLTTPDDMIAPELELELLINAGVYNIVLRRNQVRELVLSSPVPGAIASSYDLRDVGAARLIFDAMAQLFRNEQEVIRVIGAPVRNAGEVIEVTMPSAPLRHAMIDYGLRILVLSAVISVITAALLFVAVRYLLVIPIARVVSHMSAYADAPEDARRIIVPNSTVAELRAAEDALHDLQTEMTSALRQKERLAQLGGAVAKISHDLRNILTTAQLITDRIEASEDPRVQRIAPKLVSSISRAVSLCESTLAFGRVDEPPPKLDRIALDALVADLLDSERLQARTDRTDFVADIPRGLVLRADPEQLLRVLTNLVRNARQAIEATGKPGQVTVRAEEAETAVLIDVTDTGPGLPQKARSNLFTPFQGGARKGGTGLGLAIAAELVRGHGGSLTLDHTGPDGTTFRIRLPVGYDSDVTES